MGIYKFKKVPAAEYGKLVAFIDKYWKRNHALVMSKPLLDFQHLDAENGCYNFIVAENTQTNEYDALIGFISTAQYDSALKSNGDYWGAIWKIRQDIRNDELSIAALVLFRSLFLLPDFHSYSAI